MTMPLLYSILMLLGFIGAAIGFTKLVEQSPPVVLTVISGTILSLWGIGAIRMMTKKLLEWQREKKREEEEKQARLRKELAMEEELIRLRDEVSSLKRKLTPVVTIQDERKKKDA